MPENSDQVSLHYKCAFCIKSFIWMSNLTRHVSKDHDKKKTKPKSKYEVKKSAKSKVEESNVVLTKVTESHREYSLPHGWKKICQKRTNKDNSERWDFALENPEGKRIRKKKDLTEYLDSNPNVKCNRSVTDLSRPTDLDRKFELRKSSGTIEIEVFLPNKNKLPLPPDISSDPLS